MAAVTPRITRLLLVLASTGWVWIILLWRQPPQSFGWRQEFHAASPRGATSHVVRRPDGAVLIQVISDIHMEIGGTMPLLPYFPRAAPILALVGDIGNPRHPGYRNFLLTQSDRYEVVLVLAGNHEFYQLVAQTTRQAPQDGAWPFEALEGRIAEICAERANLIFMNRTRYVVGRALAEATTTEGVAGDVVVLGTTLWSHMEGLLKDQAEVLSNDYRNIYTARPAPSLLRTPGGGTGGEGARGGGIQLDAAPPPSNGWQKKRWAEVQQREWVLQQHGIHGQQLLTSDRTNAWHSQQLAWLREEVLKAQARGQRVVVLTHHAPTSVDTIEDIEDDLTRRVTVALDSTPLEAMIRPPIAAWIFAHTHKNRDAVIGGARLVSNQLGWVPKLTRGCRMSNGHRVVPLPATRT